MYGDARPLFIVTTVVIIGLMLFVGFVLVKMREPWVRNQALAVPPAPEPVPTTADEKIAVVPEKELDPASQDESPKND